MSPSDVLSLVRVRPPARGARTAAGPGRSRRKHGALVLFACAFALYATVGAILIFVYHFMIGDAVARVANATHAIYSRDPHLGSIGFVWPPLPTLVLMPLIAFKGFFPALVTRGFAANLASATFMAGAVVQLRGTLGDRGIRPRTAWALTAAFALHPMILFYGGNGMTEAALIFFLVLITRAVARWLDRGALRPLIVAAVGLACAYLTRFEAVAAGAAVVGLVAVVSYRRAKGPDRRRIAAADVAIVAAPMVFAAAGWALVSWVIVGSPFPEFSSVYGNASYVTLTAAKEATGLGGVARQVLVLEPALGVVCALALWCAVRRKDGWALAPAAAVGGALAFQVAAFLSGQTVGLFRYYILVVPLAALAAGAVPRPASDCAERRGPRAGSRTARLVPMGLASAALVLSALPTAAMAMRRVDIAPQEAPIRFAFRSGLSLAERRDGMEKFTVERRVAAYLDPLRLPRGSVLLDVAFGFPIVLDSRNAKQFVIPPDRDFEAALAAPELFHIRYILAVPNSGLGAIDAVNRAYPKVFDDGASLGRLVHEFRGKDSVWRLYRVGG